MAKQGFLARLIKEKAIESVEPSNEVSQAYLDKSRRYMETSNLLFRNKRFEESISMSYFSMYYSLLSILFKAGIKSENHAASIILLKEIFGVDNSKISFAKTQRVDKQYYIDFKITEADAKEMLEITQQFNSELENRISRIKLEEIKEYRKEFEGWLGKHC